MREGLRITPLSTAAAVATHLVMRWVPRLVDALRRKKISSFVPSTREKHALGGFTTKSSVLEAAHPQNLIRSWNAASVTARLVRWGMFDLVEPRVRRLVADHLGVDVEELTPDVSLTDELAADSLDLLELALVLENDFGIVMAEDALERVRTYGDLLHTVQALTGRRREAEAAAEPKPLPTLVWARVSGPPGRSHGDLQRAGWLTPYTAEEIAEDAVRAGRGARLEVMVSPEVSDAILARLQSEFSWLGDRGVQVSVRRDHHRGPFAQGLPPHAAA
jgi:acyl carrier protein